MNKPSINPHISDSEYIETRHPDPVKVGILVKVADAGLRVLVPSPFANTSDACWVPEMGFDTPERELPASFTDVDASAPRNNDPGTTIPDEPGVSVCPAIT